MAFAQSVDGYVGIAMTEQTMGVRNLYTANPEIAVFYKTMNVVTLSYSKHK